MSETPKPDPRLTTRPEKPVHVIPQRMPLPVGRVVKASDLTRWEREQLAKLGYDGESDLPSDLASRLSTPAPTEISPELEAAIARAADAMPAGYQPPTEGLDMSKVRTVDAPEAADEIMDKYLDAIERSKPPRQPPQTQPMTAAAQAFAAARDEGMNAIKERRTESSMDPTIAKAYRDLQHELETPAEETPAPTENRFSAGQPQPAQADEQATAPETLTPEQRQAAAIEAAKARVSEEDIERFIECLLTFKTFTKTYKLLGDDIEVTFGDLGIDDQDMLIRQEAYDRSMGRTQAADLVELMATTVRYRFAGSLRRLHVVSSNAMPVDIPLDRSMTEFLAEVLGDRSQITITGFNDGDTNLRVWQRILVKRVLNSSLARLLYRQFDEFEHTLRALHFLAASPAFFETRRR